MSDIWNPESSWTEASPMATSCFVGAAGNEMRCAMCVSREINWGSHVSTNCAPVVFTQCQEEELQTTAHPMSLTWASHIAETMLMEWWNSTQSINTCGNINYSVPQVPTSMPSISTNTDDGTLTCRVLTHVTKESLCSTRFIICEDYYCPCTLQIFVT